MDQLKLFKVGIAFFAIIAIGIFIAINIQNNPTVTDQRALKIGYIGALSGPFATDWGIDATNSATLAAEKINAEGKIHVQLYFGDSKGDPKQGVNEFRRIAQVYHPDIFMVDASAVAAASAPLAKEFNVPILFGAVASTDITKDNQLLFRNFYICNQSTKLSAQKAAQALGIQKVAILAQNDGYGMSCAHSFKEFGTEQGMAFDTFEVFNATDTDFKTPLSKIAQTDAQVIYVNGYANSLIQILKEIKELGISKKVITEMPIYASVIRNEVTQYASEIELYFIVTDYYEGSQKANEFKKDYATRFNKGEPNHAGAYIYDSIFLLKDAKQKSIESQQPLVESLADASFDGINGLLFFNENRETEIKYYFVKLNSDGTITKLE